MKRRVLLDNKHVDPLELISTDPVALKKFILLR